MSSLLSVENVQLEYSDGTRALSDVGFHLSAGESASIVGPSGSGKTSLLLVLGGLILPTTGDVTISGQSVARRTDADRRALRLNNFGVIFQDGYLLNELNAIDNVALPLRLQRESKVGAREVAAGMMEKVGLAGLEHRRLNELSGGQRQRVGVARALVGKPGLVLADEPTGSLDSTSSSLVADIILELCAMQGSAVLIVTHSEAVAERCERRFLMLDGRLSVA